ncbi:BEN domain isoform 2 [Schistosoma japonicum]|uniref:BEN domain isoform 2 n=1 Tax=Schistosoma japonicum TaxID=6182 RepID=A0A4Z2CZR1_SCHJA|nr:BEN domain isoform 2 [Schistosoma japonicum]
MPKSILIHAMHQFNDFNDAFIDSKYDISDEQYYYGSNKRKRKTAAPQKREPTEDNSKENVKMLLKNSSFGPINLVTKENNIFLSSMNGTEHLSESSSDSSISTSPEHIRLYATMLNYFLMKYKTPVDLKSGLFSTSASMTGVNHEFDKNSSTSFPNNLSHLFCPAQLNQNVNPMTITQNKQIPFNGSLNDESCYSNSKEIDKLYKHISTKYEAYLDYRQTVINSISTCITSIPVPKSGYPNYEAMSVCYKSLIDRAYALQQSVELYFGMIQNSLSYNSFSNQQADSISINSAVPNVVWSGQTSNINNFSGRPPFTSSSYSPINFPAVLTDIFQANSSSISSQELINEYKRVSGIAFEPSGQLESSYLSECQAQNNLQSPVDLTNTDKNKLVDPFVSNLPSLIETRANNSDKSNKENSYEYHTKSGSERSDGVQKSEHDRIPTLEQDAEYTFPNASEQNMVPKTDVQNGFISQNLKHGASNMLCSSVITCSPRSNINMRKKVYFKSKRVKKSFTSSSISNTNSICPENSSPKKSNFRGTSEEENKVAPNFKPVEVNNQILLSEAHPNVKLSKDIFYSLIVKSSGSATRLIRLLMKSFFTQDELAASSLSGEGIYKQRLEPSVTEAIKIFIRQRHPQLKTGSINLCMTDVCVQARRVANNQRSRQHPLRISSPTQESSKSHRNGTNDQQECESLLGLKNRINNSTRSTSATGKLKKHNHENTVTTIPTTSTEIPIINEYNSSYCIEIPKSEINDTHFSESDNDEPILQIVDERNEIASDNIGTPASCSVNSFMSDQK